MSLSSTLSKCTSYFVSIVDCSLPVRSGLMDLLLSLKHNFFVLNLGINVAKEIGHACV